MKKISSDDAVEVTGGVVSGTTTLVPLDPEPIVEYPKYPTNPVEPIDTVQQ